MSLFGRRTLVAAMSLWSVLPGVAATNEKNSVIRGLTSDGAPQDIGGTTTRDDFEVDIQLLLEGDDSAGHDMMVSQDAGIEIDHEADCDARELEQQGIIVTNSTDEDGRGCGRV